MWILNMRSLPIHRIHPHVGHSRDCAIRENHLDCQQSYVRYELSSCALLLYALKHRQSLASQNASVRIDSQRGFL